MVSLCALEVESRDSDRCTEPQGILTTLKSMRAMGRGHITFLLEMGQFMVSLCVLQVESRDSDRCTRPIGILTKSW